MWCLCPDGAYAPLFTVGILTSADFFWKLSNSPTRRTLYGNSYTIPTPSIHTIQQLGLAVSKSYSSHPTRVRARFCLNLAGNVGKCVCRLHPSNDRHFCLSPTCWKCRPDTSATFCYVGQFLAVGVVSVRPIADTHSYIYVGNQY